jgi:hypothetical protein
MIKTPLYLRQSFEAMPRTKYSLCHDSSRDEVGAGVVVEDIVALIRALLQVSDGGIGDRQHHGRQVPPPRTSTAISEEDDVSVPADAANYGIRLR